uniref:Uncharacterized protein n=1 Tax=Globodera rostochiensis TaxID=31243 RepID=A0A914IE30_GLORO
MQFPYLELFCDFSHPNFTLIPCSAGNNDNLRRDAGAQTLEPVASHLTSVFEGFFDGLLEQHSWSRGVGLLKTFCQAGGAPHGTRSRQSRTGSNPQELEPRGRDEAWKPALGSILEL